MLGRSLLALASAAAACASWVGRPHASVDSPDLRIATAPRAPTALDVAYRDLANGMRVHGCTRCHVLDRTQLFDSRRAIEAMIDANLMPPEADDHAAGLADPAARADLLRRARRFRAIGDAAVASW